MLLKSVHRTLLTAQRPLRRGLPLSGMILRNHASLAPPPTEPPSERLLVCLDLVSRLSLPSPSCSTSIGAPVCSIESLSLHPTRRTSVSCTARWRTRGQKAAGVSMAGWGKSSWSGCRATSLGYSTSRRPCACICGPTSRRSSTRRVLRWISRPGCRPPDSLGVVARRSRRSPIWRSSRRRQKSMRCGSRASSIQTVSSF